MSLSQKKGAYYNENDSFAVEWLRNLIKAGLIAAGEVDDRDIQNVEARDLVGFRQCHFFAGIGVWSYALRAAGWPDDSPVWTGSCPCQGFSASGKRGGFSDKRHLWPAWFRLIKECLPDAIFGEQVASQDGLAWLDVVSADLEGAGYAIGTADLCAAGFGAPHIRQRLYFVAESLRPRGREINPGIPGDEEADGRARWLRSEPDSNHLAASFGEACRLADTERTGQRGRRAGEAGREPAAVERPERLCAIGEFGDAAPNRCEMREPIHGKYDRQGLSEGRFTNGFWADAEWLWCRDGKYRPVEPKFIWMVNGTSGTMEPMRDQGAQIKLPKAEEGLVDATNTKTRSRQVLRELPNSTTSSAVRQWKVRGSRKLHTKEILQSRLHGAGNDRDDQDSQREEQSPAIAEIRKADMRVMWESGTITRSSQGHKPLEQCAREFADFVRLLPSSYALAQLCGDAATEKALLALCEAVGASGLVQYTSLSVEEVRRSFGEEVENRLRLGFESGSWVRSYDSPLVTGATNRMGRLRGYGNAIIPQVAAEFIRAFGVPGGKR